MNIRCFHRSYSGKVLIYLILLFPVPCLIYSQYSDSISVLQNYDTSTLKTNSDKHKNDSIADEYERSKQFYDSLKIKAERHQLTKNLHRILVRKESDNAKNGYDHSDKFQPYQGKIIRNIKIKQLAVFGQSIYDTTIYPNKWIDKFGNSLHINSNMRVIRNKLLFKRGDILTPLIIADNERILRELPNIKNVIILVNPVENNADSVDITIITQDVWPIGFSYEALDVAYGTFGLWNTNLFGIGHEIKYQGYYNLNKTPNYAYKAKYRINNIGNTFIYSDLAYENLWNLETYRFNIERSFITPETKYAGGVGYENVSTLWNVYLSDTILEEIPVEYNLVDAWLGRSFLLRRFNNIQTRTNFFMTGRYQHYDFLKRPELEINQSTLYQLHQRDIFLGSIGLTKQGFYTSHLIYGFGDPEDVPYGHMIKITGGIERSEFKTRPYLGFEFLSGTYINNIGYIYNNFEIGSFFDDKIEQSALFYEGNYISNLIGKGRFRFRIYNKLVLEQGYNRFDGEYLVLKTQDGIRGIATDLHGTQRLYSNNELVAFSPHYIYGFRFVYYLFYDFGMINSNNDCIFRNPVYSSVGIGVRIRNERLVFNTLQLRLAYFPHAPSGADLDKIQLTGYPKTQHKSFAVQKPSILNYNYY